MLWVNNCNKEYRYFFFTYKFNIERSLYRPSHLPKHVFDRFIEFSSDRRAFDGSREPVKNEYKAHLACRTKFVKRNTVTFPSLEFREVTLRSDFENLREIEMHFQRKLFLKWLASPSCCGEREIALYFKLPLLLSKMSAFTARDSRKTKKNLFVDYWLIAK